MVARKPAILFLLALARFGAPSLAGEDLLQYILKHNPPIEHIIERRPLPSRANISEIRLGALLFVRIYQTCISSQDRATCNFTVSCSNFCYTSIRDYGVIFGLLMTADRLSRCHSMGRRYYQRDPLTGLAIDYPVQRYYLGPISK